jgi:hypothetical protein
MISEKTIAIMKNKLKPYLESITEKSKGKNMYVCPFCGSGKGKNKTGALSITDDEQSWKCFACNKSGDIFDLVGYEEDLTDFRDQAERLGEILDIDIENTDLKEQEKQPIRKKENTEQNLTSFFLEANKNLVNTTYYRGISKATLDKYKVGFIEDWKNPKAPDTAPATPRLIIPTSQYSYLARDTRDTIPDYQSDFIKTKVGRLHIFNIDALYNPYNTLVYVVEGELDALSILDNGRPAIALGSVSMINKFIKQLKEKPIYTTLILALDKDQKGQEATLKLEKELINLGVDYIKYNPSLMYKDPNQAHMNSPVKFFDAVNIPLDEMKKQTQTQEQQDYKQNSALNLLAEFKIGLTDKSATNCIPTGFEKLDEILSGGLYEGLVTIGAESSLGKTTLALQLADQIAQQGNDALFFSLEMSKMELVAKSISRHTLLQASRDDIRLAKTVREITNPDIYRTYTDKDSELLEKSISNYETYANHLYYIEGVGNITTSKIRQQVEKHIQMTGNRPVVIIDYIQIIASENQYGTDKQNIDKIISELKRISRDNKIVLIAISSFNRANYGKEVSLDSFKETGSIEYSSDLLLGLQFKGVSSKNFNQEEAKKQTPREMELVILKNRNGKTGEKIQYRYYQPYNLFQELP